MAPKFGTSGLRGLVTELTDPLCAGYVRAFLRAVPQDGRLMIARDLRPSSARIAATVADTAAEIGLQVADCGEVPTPALALAAMSAGAPSVMVTGSHIPADRNGLKFYSAAGEITKADEAAIVAGFSEAAPAAKARPEKETAARAAYAARYTAAYGKALKGLRIAVYQHSSVARDLLAEVLEALGAEVTPLGRSDSFVPVDTEAVSDDTRRMLTGWAAGAAYDAIVSLDGDADRPLVTDAAGRVIPGDVIGTLTAAALGADTVVTPVSSNTLIEASGLFRATERTRIGSPYVIAAMEALKAAPGARVVGFEANGGFLLGFAAEGPSGPIAPLMTRDAFLPIIATLATAAARGMPLADLVAGLPARVTASDRLEEVPTEWSQAFVARLIGDEAARTTFFAGRRETDIDLTEGLRVTFSDGAILHLRPSGNAPELRCYAETSDTASATALVRDTLARIADLRNHEKAP
ncbi:MAG: phosphomannomutase [Proteobacteria bacterium]|nr:phosphomannomutase [Pseudomonadota bacterium]